MSIVYTYISFTIVEDATFFVFVLVFVLDTVAVEIVVVEAESIVLSSSFVFEGVACKTFFR